MHACSLATVPLLMSIGGVVSYEAVNHHRYAAHYYCLYVYLWATMQVQLNLTENPQGQYSTFNCLSCVLHLCLRETADV